MFSKTCTHCGVDTPIDGFALRSIKTGATRSDCKLCQSVERAKRKAKTTEYNKAYHAANKSAMSKRNSDYHAANRERLLPAMRQRNIERYHSDSEYQSRVLTQCAARRAPSDRFIPSWADHDAIQSVYSYAAILRSIGMSVEVDHIIPIKSSLVCGLHVHENLRVVPKLENRQKKNMRWPTDMPYAETMFRLPL